jgi:outer membrane protein insertion porin family
MSQKRRNLIRSNGHHLRSVFALILFTSGNVARADVSQYDGLDISEVVVEGVRRIDEDAVIEKMRSQVKSRFSASVVSGDLRVLWGTGFFRDVQIYVEQGTTGVKVTVVVAEKPSIRKVTLSGADGVSEDDLEEVMDIKALSILNVDKVKENIEKIRDLYVTKGYYLAVVKHRIESIEDAPDEVDVFFDIRENAKVVVKEISFIGNQHVPAAEIKGFMQTREGNEFSFLTQSGTYKEEFFDTDLLRIQALYYERGYVTVKVGTPTATISPDLRHVYLSVPIEEGPVFDIGDIGFSGELELRDEKGKVVVDEALLKGRLNLKSGQRFSRTALFGEIQRLTDTYRDHGYAFANVTPNSSIRKDTRKVDLDLELDKGELVYIGRIDITGNTKTRDKVVRRQIRLNEGDRYSATLLKRSKARVFQLGYFETVDITTENGDSPTTMNVRVQIKEKSTGTFQVGAGFSSVESFIATAQISQNNFLGNGQLLTVSAQLSFGDFGRQLANFQFYEPYFLDSHFSFGFNAYIQQRFYRDFQRSAKGISPSFGYLLTPDLRLNLGYTLEDIGISNSLSGNAAGNALFSLNVDGINSALNANISYDTRDNRLFPSRGQYHLISTEVSSEKLGSSSGLAYNRLQGNFRYYHSLPLSLVLKLNLKLGYVFTFDGGPVPISERFFPGGIYSVRGFEPRGLGPTIRTLVQGDPMSTSTDFILGGNKEAVFNVEIEFPIIPAAQIKGVVFADAGNAFNEDQNFFYIDTPESLRPPAYLLTNNEAMPGGPPLGLYFSLGFGFRWFSPIGPLRFEWGIPIIKRATTDRDIIFEFTIGNFF